MSNWTTIILVPPISDGNSFLAYCNQYLKDKEGDDYPLFTESEISLQYNGVLMGHFPYLNESPFFKYLQTWFHPEPEYKVVDETEKPTKYLSQLYTQTNERWGIIQIMICREHDGQFWLCNISKDSIEEIGLEGMPIL